MAPRQFFFVITLTTIAFAAVSIIAQSQVQVNMTCNGCYQYQITYYSTVLATYSCPAGTVCNETSVSPTSVSPCSASYTCNNVTGNSTVFVCQQIGKFPSLTSCNEYYACARLNNGSIIPVIRKCPGRTLFNNILRMCSLNRSCGNNTYIPPTQ